MKQKQTLTVLILMSSSMDTIQLMKMRIIMVLFPSILSAMLMAENSTEEHTGPTANTKPAAKFIIPQSYGL